MKLKELRENKGAKQEDLAKYLGLTYQAYSHYEKGRREPSLDVLVKLASYFNVSIDYLITGADKPVQASKTREQELFDSLSVASQKYAISVMESLLDVEKNLSMDKLRELVDKY